MKNANHLDNFKSNKSDRVAIFDVTHEVDGYRYFEIASGKTADEAKENFFMRFMLRGSLISTEKELMLKAQGRLMIAKLKHNQFDEILERNAVLIAA